MEATYSPEDNKLRLYAGGRLDKETYNQVRSIGFRWAPRQELFVAPMWTPAREDLLIELCGEIGDEDTSLVDRAEKRAERFENYSEKRAEDAHNAKEGVQAITDHIPFGQPILVGHHSEKRARKDAERIENGMRKAVKMWETSEYWKDRAAGALRHAKYKEKPQVRARRIKKIEAERRKLIRSYTPDEPDQVINQTPWHCPVCKVFSCEVHPEAKTKIPHVWCGPSRGGWWQPVKSLPGIKARAGRWLNHYENRLTYEKAMLGEQGGLDLLKKPKRPKQLPLLNYWAPEGISIENIYHKGEFSVYPQLEMTKAEYMKIYVDHRGTATIEHSHRVRALYRYAGGHLSRNVIFLTDSKVHKKPEAIEPKPKETPLIPRKVSTYTPPERTEFDDIKDTLREGVKTVSAPQLFPTPNTLIDKMLEYADVTPGHRVLEPSAGTGAILKKIPCVRPDGNISAVEINQSLCDQLRPYADDVLCGDFLSFNGDLLKFDKIIMNPPFHNGQDIKHIEHALTFLKPGGRLVALCANGPRQRDKLMPMADEWEDLPEGSFKNAGTMVNTALLVIDN